MNSFYSSMPAEMPALPETVRMTVQKMDPGLPLPSLVSYYALEKDRKLYLDSEVDNSVLGIQRMILRWNMEDAGRPAEERKPIHLYIFSPGGDVDLMWSLIDTIEASETPVYTVNMGMAASAAGLIFMSGHRRYMLKRASVMIHEGSAHVTGDAIKVMDAGESYKKALAQMKDYILKHTGISPAMLNRKRCHDWELDSDYCLEHGVCDTVVSRLCEIL